MKIYLKGNKICKKHWIKPLLSQMVKLHPWKLGQTPVEYLRNIKIYVFVYARSLFFLMEAVYMSKNRAPSVVARSFRYLRSVGMAPPWQHSRTQGCWQERSCPSDPAVGTPPLGDLGAVLPLFPEPSPAGATPDGTPGSPRWVTPYLEKKGRHKGVRPLSSDAATNHVGVSSGGANAEQAKLLSGPASSGRPGWDARGPGGEGSRGLCKASAPPVVRPRAQLPPEVAPRGESTGRILS